MRYVLFPFKLMLFLIVVTVWCLGDMKSRFPRWNTFLGSVNQPNGKREMLDVQVQSSGGWWGTRFQCQNTDVGRQQSMERAVKLSATGRVRCINRSTGQIVDMMQA